MRGRDMMAAAVARAAAGADMTTPTLVFDGECGLCRYLVDYARGVTGSRVRYAPFQEVAAEYPQVSLAEFARSIQLFEGASRYEGAEAAFRVLAVDPRRAPWLWCHRHVPGFARVSEWAYGFVADHRPQLYRMARPLFGPVLAPASYERIAWLFEKLLACVFLIAFLSFVVQAPGLIGSDGIVPVSDFFPAVAQQLGPERYWWLPSLFWFSTSDAMLYWVSALGMLGATLMLLHLRPASGALLAYVAYLSLVGAAQSFMAFQWDILLLECGVAAIVLARHQRLGIWLYRLLLFRFMWLSGVVKLASGDSAWRTLTALEYHFETQPLPTALAWYADKLPHGLLTAGVVAMLTIELVLPFFIFGPRRLRMIAAGGFVLLQTSILLTGSYNFFNLLTIFLCLPLLDDRALPPWLRARNGERGPQRAVSRQAWRVIGAAFLALNLVYVGLAFDRDPESWARRIAAYVSPVHVVNSYGVFAVMTTERRELIIEGSRDGVAWRPYELPFKPGDVRQRPRLATPHQPRLDWQLWFAALTSREHVPWMNGLVVRLLLGSRPVLKLFAFDPFSDGPPPTFLRIRIYRYTFTSVEERRASGAWWRRTLLGEWYPEIEMRARESVDR